MRKAWFVYEMGAKGPTVAIYYDDPPNEKNRLNRTVLQKHELGEEHFNNDGEIAFSFNKLSTDFPYTGNHYDLEAAE